MRKFIIHTRTIPGYAKSVGALTVVEVEGGVIKAVEDPCVNLLPQGEFRFRIVKPEFLYESQEVKKADGSKEKVMVPTIYHSHSIYDTATAAHKVAENLVRHEFEFEKRKYSKEYTDEEVTQRIDSISFLDLK